MTMEPPVPVRIFSNQRRDAAGRHENVAMTPDLLADARRYALGWQEQFGRFPQGQHPLKFPVNRQITLQDADLILEFPATPVELP